MRGREEDLLSRRPDERARRLAEAGRDAFDVARAKVERVDLIERIPRLALALEDESLPIGGPVTFSRTTTFEGQPADLREEILLAPRLSRTAGRGFLAGQQSSKQTDEGDDDGE